MGGAVCFCGGACEGLSFGDCACVLLFNPTWWSVYAPTLLRLLSTCQGPHPTIAPLPFHALQTSSDRCVSSCETQSRTLVSVFECPLPHSSPSSPTASVSRWARPSRSTSLTGSSTAMEGQSAKVRPKFMCW